MGRSKWIWYIGISSILAIPENLEAYLSCRPGGFIAAPCELELVGILVLGVIYFSATAVLDYLIRKVASAVSERARIVLVVVVVGLLVLIWKGGVIIEAVQRLIGF